MPPYSLSMPTKRAELMNRALEKRDLKSHVDGWLGAGDDQERLVALAAERRKEDSVEPPSLLNRRWDHVSWPVLGGLLHRLREKGSNGRPLVLYLHGGYYVVGPHAVEWLTMARFCRKRGLDLAVLHYPRVPEFVCDQTLASTVEAWDLLERRYGADRIAVVGMSAGGGLALSLAMMLRDAGRPLPVGLGLSSPWLDLACAHPELAEYEASDVILSSAGGRRDGELYAGPNRSVSDPLISPFYADPAGLPPVHIQVGSDEIFLPECRDFAARCEAAGVETEYVVDPAGPHVGMMLPTGEGAALREQLGAFVTRVLS